MSVFYQESERISKPMLLLSFLLLFVISFFMAYAYLAATLFIPVFLNPFLTIGFGLALGLFNSGVFRITKNRSKNSRYSIAIASGLFALFFQWNVALCVAYTGHMPSFSLYFQSLNWINLPTDYFQSLADINETGWWKIGKIPINGFALTVVWILEAIIILAIPIAFVYKHAVYPFSEKENRWYPKYTLLRDFESIPVGGRLLNDLKNGVLEAIASLEKGSATRHTKIHIYFLPEEDFQYLTFERVNENGGGINGRKHIVLNNFKIDTATAKAILNTYANNREKNEIL